MYEKELQNAGLSVAEANVYAVLISNDGLTASAILKKVNEKIEKDNDKKCETSECKKLTRQNVYKIIDDLVNMNLAKKLIEKKSKTLFYALTPRNLEKKIKRDMIKLENSQFALDNIIDELDNIFNLNSNKPGVQVYTGPDNINRVYDDMLKAKDTIYTYIDPTEDINNDDVKKQNDYYVRQRKRLGIKKKIIVFNVDGVEEWAKGYGTGTTEVKIWKNKESGDRIPTIIHIYNDKVVYVNFLKKNEFSIFIMQNEYLYNIQRKLFENTWAML